MPQVCTDVSTTHTFRFVGVVSDSFQWGREVFHSRLFRSPRWSSS